MGLSFGHIIVVLLVVVLVFGTGKLRSLGGDLGGAIKSFRDALNGGADHKDQPPTTISQENNGKDRQS